VQFTHSQLQSRKSVTSLLFALILLFVTTSQSQKTRGLPSVFASAVPQIKAKSHVPLFLPSELPKAIGDVQYAVVDKAATNEYSASLLYDPDAGDAGFAAMFAGNTAPSYSPRNLPNTHVVKLARGLHGYFRPISCGGSCAPVNLWWQDGSVLYSIQLKAIVFTGRETTKSDCSCGQFGHSCGSTVRLLAGDLSGY